MKDSPIVDYLGMPIHVGDSIAYATTTRIWTGRVTEIREYDSDWDGKWYKIQMNVRVPGGTRRHITFDNVPEKMYLILGGDK